MKIGPLEQKPAATPASAERKTQGAGPSGGTEPSAHVAISSAALSAQDGADGTFDAEKVKRIAQAIQDGKFQVNPEVIADKLIANAQELLGKTGTR